jgi:hypothetical protein
LHLCQPKQLSLLSRGTRKPNLQCFFAV